MSSSSINTTIPIYPSQTGKKKRKKTRTSGNSASPFTTPSYYDIFDRSRTPLTHQMVALLPLQSLITAIVASSITFGSSPSWKKSKVSPPLRPSYRCQHPGLPPNNIMTYLSGRVWVKDKPASSLNLQNLSWMTSTETLQDTLEWRVRIHLDQSDFTPSMA